MNLLQLVAVSEDQRDSKWEQDFFHALTSGHLKLVHEAPQKGPDGWPYLLSDTHPEATESANKIIQWLALKGVGLVINPLKQYPDFVFTYGMLWHFKETGLFFRNTADGSTVGSLEIEEGQPLHAGPPSPQYLPHYVRNILKEFFLDQGIYRPKILVMSSDRKNYDLVFSLESLGNPPKEEHEGIAEAISWFLPPHYSIGLISEAGLPQFVDLA
jgi:hypothetical protein